MDCIVLFKSTVTLDDILPLVMELTKQRMIDCPLFVAWDKQLYDVILQNEVLYEGINFVGGKMICLNRYKNRYINQLHNIYILRKYLFKKILSLEYETGNRWVSLFSKFNRKVWKGKRVLSLIFNRPYKPAVSHMSYYRIVMGNSERKKKIVRKYDYVLLSQLKSQYEEIQNISLEIECPEIIVGYTRGMKKWEDFLIEKMRRIIPANIKPPYFFFVLNQLGAFIPGEDCPPGDVLLKESLCILREYNNDILTVFKPHYNTDVKGVKDILGEVGYKNYIISYAHPWILAKKAKFTFSYTGSSILLDAYYNGCPTVEYAHYDSRYAKVNNGKPRYLEWVDYFSHRDPHKLKKIFDELIFNDIEIKRDLKKLKEDFPVLSSYDIREKFKYILQ